MDPPTPVIYLLPTHLNSDELRQWGDRVASIARITQVAGEADFLVGKGMSSLSAQAVFLPNAQRARLVMYRKTYSAVARSSARSRA